MCMLACVFLYLRVQYRYLVCRILWQVEIRWLPGMSLVSLYNHSTILQTKIIITITNIMIIINNNDTIMVLFQHWYVGKQVSEGRRCLPNHNVDLVGDTIINEYIMNRAKHKTSCPIWRCLCGNKQGACPVIGKVPLEGPLQIHHETITHYTLCKSLKPSITMSQRPPAPTSRNLLLLTNSILFKQFVTVILILLVCVSFQEFGK